MTQQMTERQAAGQDSGAAVTIDWETEANEEGGPTRWFGSWLLAGEPVEGPWFYGGYGGERTEHAMPPGARGVRVRKWVSEGLDPEYVDVLLTGGGHVRTGALDFDTPQDHRILQPSHMHMEEEPQFHHDGKQGKH